MATVGTPDHNNGCLRRSPLTSHTTTEGSTGQQFVTKTTPQGGPGTSRAKPVEPSKLRNPTFRNPPHHQSGTYGRLSKEGEESVHSLLLKEMEPAFTLETILESDDGYHVEHIRVALVGPTDPLNG